MIDKDAMFLQVKIAHIYRFFHPFLKTVIWPHIFALVRQLSTVNSGVLSFPMAYIVVFEWRRFREWWLVQGAFGSYIQF